MAPEVQVMGVEVMVLLVQAMVEADLVSKY
jgi:hypothetical protein